jgi:hypothetical protein
MPRVITLLFLTSLAACGSVPDGPGSGDDAPDANPLAPDADPSEPDADPSDATAPMIVSISPLTGASGITPDAVIVVEFSEPMDRGVTEAAWASPDLPAAAVAFGWNAIGDTLTVTPQAPLELAEGTGLDPSAVVPRSYSFTIGVGAADAAGNSLPSPVSSMFTTARRMQVDLTQIPALTRGVDGTGEVISVQTDIGFGDDNVGVQYKGFAGFQLPMLPASATLETATLGAAQVQIIGAPYVLGPLVVRHINTPTIDAGDFNAAALADLGVLSTAPALGARSLDVTAAVADDLANHAARGGRNQYRLEHATSTNADGEYDLSVFRRVDFTVSLTYLAP